MKTVVFTIKQSDLVDDMDYPDCCQSGCEMICESGCESSFEFPSEDSDNLIIRRDRDGGVGYRVEENESGVLLSFRHEGVGDVIMHEDGSITRITSGGWVHRHYRNEPLR